MKRIALALAVASLAACSSPGHRAESTPTPSSAGTSASPASTTTDSTVWLCRPGAPHNPCESSLVATAVLADGTRRADAAPKPVDTGLDCFYVYPTVSRETTANADLRIQKEETDVAIAQAARFSTVCRVWAPMYRQRTISDLFNLGHGAVDSPQNALALASVRSAWIDYLAHENGGRPVVLIGHSQGAAMLIRLIRADIDPDPAARHKIALAILLGGNVTVADGRRTGGSFQHMELCTRKGERGCVIAYSSFPSEPPAFSFFGRAGSGVSALSGETATNRQVGCVNPAAIGGSGLLHPYAPSAQLPAVAVSTPWATFPDQLRAECRHAGTATWLQVTPTHNGAGLDGLLNQGLGPPWGYHIVDVTIALGDLVSDVAALR